MQLVSLPVSPFAARVRLAIYAKGLPIELVAPPSGWPNNPQFRDVSPMGRVPVLLHELGALWESAVILEFLEEQFPETPALLPAAPFDRALARLLVRHVDLYMMPPMTTLAEPHRSERDALRATEALVDAFVALDGLLDGGRYAVGDQLTFADCALAPALFAARVTSGRLGLDLVETAPNAAAYAREVQGDPHVARVLEEMERGLAALLRVG